MVHTYRSLGLNIALDVNSGAVHILDDVSYELVSLAQPVNEKTCPESVLARFDAARREDVKDAWEELYDLRAAGMLFSEDDYEDKLTNLPREAPVKALCLHVAHDCNLRCAYCFASTGDFGGGRKIMSPETARKAIDFVVARSGKRKNIEIDFFGGEPLMAFDTVVDTVNYARSKEGAHNKKFRFTITTNGLLLDEEKIRYINDNMDNVVLSLDGRKETNDAFRKTPGGGGSYGYVTPKFKALAEARSKEYYVRGTFTRRNMDFSKDVLHLAELGFRNISVEPVVSDGADAYAIRESDMPAVFDEYDRLAEIMAERDDFNFFHFMVDLRQGPCIVKRLRGCGAGFEYAAVTPEGDIYPCHQFVGKDEYKMGNLNDGSFDAGLSGRFASCNVYTRGECRVCWAKFYCGGGCAASNVTATGETGRVNAAACEMQKKRFECAIAIKAAKMAR